jgi:hypothetical protein
MNKEEKLTVQAAARQRDAAKRRATARKAEQPNTLVKGSFRSFRRWTKCVEFIAKVRVVGSSPVARS